mmetsp:Transcript_15981/g.37884  ORF Transcript_15981/g.37884 Transcript_15981/m.37884 type:complete len:93 (-) Transcript_15981:420-698(-)
MTQPWSRRRSHAPSSSITSTVCTPSSRPTTSPSPYGALKTGTPSVAITFQDEMAAAATEEEAEEEDEEEEEEGGLEEEAEGGLEAEEEMEEE